jgi:hypothetical protein
MSEKSEEQTATQMMTNVKGYFNPNPYRVNVSISELGGLSIQLGPMEFILERATGRKINDPMLNTYVGYRMLSPELSNVPVPVVPMPRLVPTQHSQHVVGQGVRGPNGKWGMPAPGSALQLPEPQVMVQTPPNVSKPSVAAMSMDEARRRGFVGKTKLVPEDYGAAETDGAPTRGDAIPRIKYSMESAAPMARPGALPKELVEQVDPKVAPIIASLEAAAQTDPETVSLGRKAAEEAVAAQQGKEGVQKFRAARQQIKAKTPAAPPVVQTTLPPAPQPRRRIGQVVSPVTPVVSVPLPVAPESPLMAGRTDELPPPVLEESQPVEPPELPPTAEDRAQGGMSFRCAACGKEYPYRSYYIRHIQRAHKDRLAELMPPQHP